MSNIKDKKSHFEVIESYRKLCEKECGGERTQGDESARSDEVGNKSSEEALK